MDDEGSSIGSSGAEMLWCEARGVLEIPRLVHVSGFLMIEGWRSIMNSKGQQIGAIGVSGANAEQDGVCAQAAEDLVKNDLK
jgi:uncharacterized protein GlcG (DUF336 family)